MAGSVVVVRGACRRSGLPVDFADSMELLGRIEVLMTLAYQNQWEQAYASLRVLGHPERHVLFPSSFSS